ncbi:transposase family protein [Moraxella lincolnii]
MATLQYLKEYHTYEQIAVDFGIHEGTLIHKSHYYKKPKTIIHCCLNHGLK